jgi:hypothetical protein
LARNTLKVAQEVFGQLSTNWNYIKDGKIVADPNEQVTCDAQCNGHCAGSTNCQE